MTSNRMVKARETIIEMFNQRGYTDIDSDIDNRILAIKPDGEQVCAFGSIIEKLNNDEIHSYIAQLQQDEIKHGLLVYEGIPTPAVKSVMANLPELGINIEIFHADDLQFNLTKHVLVPKHVLLSKEDAKEFRLKFGINIPVILRSDAVSRFYDFHKGDIIMIIRKTGAISYRIVR
jgi:DNA-directed RNA polymerase I, II, and III subunit RPABC1